MTDNINNIQGAGSQQDYGDQVRVRRAKLEELRANGADPFVRTTYDVTAHAKDINDRFEEWEGKTVSIAGRILSKRDMGKASFIDIQDGSGRIQSYVRKDHVGDDSYAEFKKYDLGDIVGVTGETFRTQKGQISVKAESICLLSKALLPLPEKFHGLKDTELRYRQRYVDLIVNPEVRDTFLKRSQIITEVRNFLIERNYLEVETPVLHTIAGGAAARPFVTHHNTLDMDMYLRIALELSLKRLIVGGMERVFEIGRVFRNEGMDVRHNPEFTMLELYQAYTDFHGMMDLVEDMYTRVTEKVCGTLTINYQGTEIQMASPWERLTMAEAVKKYSGVDYNDWTSDEDARRAAKEKGVEVDANATKGKVLAELFDAFVEENLIQPTFIYDYPVEISPLAKRKPDDPDFTERFEFFIYAREMGNAFSELNDPIDQRARFEEQAALKAAGDEEACDIDEDFLTALEYGMPPTGGLGIGIDRMVMLLTDSASIRDVLLFPTMKPLD